MKRIVWGLMFILCCAWVVPAYSDELPPILKMVYKAEELLAKEKPHLIKRRKTVIGRDVPLAIYDAEADKILIIRASVSLERDVWRNGKLEKVVDVSNVKPADFYVVKAYGNGINTAFQITKYGKDYPFLGWHYIRQSEKETLVYSPYTEFLARPEVIAYGKKYLESVILEARVSLNKLKVYSRAIYGTLVPDVIPERTIFILALIEHMDHEEYKDHSDGGLYMGNKVLTQFALNRAKTFSYAKSSAGALCLMQIMRTTYGGSVNRRGKLLSPGILQLYPTARLSRSSVSGSCGSHLEAAKAAYLVLDDKLTFMSEDFKRQFMQEPERFGFVLAAAYNGGADRAVGLYKEIHVSRLHEIVSDIFSLFRGRRNEFREYRILREETWIFIKKYIEVDTALSSNGKSPEGK